MDFITMGQNYFWQIPIELNVKIWDICSPSDRLKMRVVCKRWYNICEKFFFTATTVFRLKISAKNGQYCIYGWKENGSKMFNTDANGLRRIITITKLCKREALRDTGLLILENDANDEMVLDLILCQSWEIRHFEIHGAATTISSKKLISFIKRQNQISGRCSMEVFRIQDGIIERGLVSDELLRVFDAGKLYFEINLKKSCAAYLSSCGISNNSLELIFKPNMRHMIPYPLASSITIAGIKQSLQNFFGTDWEAKDVGPSCIYDEENNMITKKGFYSCEFELHSTSNLQFYSIASLEFDGVEKRCLCKDGSLSSAEELCRAKVKRGRVYFISRTSERCLLVKIAVT